MDDKIFNDKKLASILGSKRKKKTDGTASGFISDKYVIKKQILELISDLVEEACAADVNNIYFVKGQLKLIERILLTELEEYVDAKDNIEDTLEIIRRQMQDEINSMRGPWTPNITTTMPQPLPGGYIGNPEPLVSIPDGGSSSDPFPYTNITY